MGKGVMISYFLTAAEAAAVREGKDWSVPAEEMHVTVLYLGKELTPEQVERARSVTQAFAAQAAPLTGTVGGPGRFPATPTSEGNDVLVRLVNVPRLEAVREELIKRLRQVGVEPQLTHGYTPHVTMAYVPVDTQSVDGPAFSTTINVDRLYFSADTNHESFPLAGHAVYKRSALAGINNRLKGAARTPTVKCDLVVQKAEDKHLAFGWASVVEIDGEPVVDRHGDVINEASMEDMAYAFVLERRTGGVMHLRDGEEPRVIGQLVESMAFTKQKQALLGVDLGRVAWWVGFRVEDEETWNAIKQGVLRSFSIHGFGRRTERKS